ncbi:MAG: UvrD-helicase domain-containing protein [bacterium]|nr:UvrD-helicase domain-containing protein [bacterium]
MNDILDQLNEPQGAAVTAAEGPVLVVAGAGSGKTRVLTTRIAWLLGERGVHPGEILAFTFTNRAAKEMRERVGATVGADRAPFWIGTFHATGLRILRADGTPVGVDRNFTIFDTDDSKRLLKDVLADLRIDPKQFTPRGARSVISDWKNQDVAPDAAKQSATSFIDEKYAEIFEGYEKALRRCNALDFDDLILRTVHLLEQHEDVRRRYAERFRHVLVDEFQDTNPLQMILIKALQSTHGNVFAVGDDDQSIYSWRGACIENMLEFDSYFPGAVTLRLEQNYRSTGNILDAANAVIAHNKRRKGKKLWTADGAGELLLDEEFQDEEDEAAKVVEIVRTELAAGGSRSDVTVLYRTNAQSRALEDALRRANLPYQVVGSLQFYERKEVRDLLAYLKVVANPADLVSLQRAINVPRRKLGATTVSRLLELAAATDLTPGQAAAEEGLLEREIAPAACKRVRAFFDMAARWRARMADGDPVPEILRGLLEDIGYMDHLETDDPVTAAGRTENVEELINAAAAFHEQTDGGRLDQFLEQVALVSDPDTITEEEGLVRLMTIHTAKGLEFPVVIVAGCEDDILPHINSQDDESSLEEERRLFYVALTRARRKVHLLHASRRRRFGQWQTSLPSRFLKEVPDGLVDRTRLDALAAGRPVARSLFGSSAAPRPGARRQQAAGGSRSHGKPTRPAVLPDQWGKRSAKPASPADSGWDADVSQEAPYYAGQLVSHGIFGSGVVVRVEGTGDDMLVTVDFNSGDRKHLNPRFAPLVPVD